jgi:hypothetical protein
MEVCSRGGGPQRREKKRRKLIPSTGLVFRLRHIVASLAVIGQLAFNIRVVDAGKAAFVNTPQLPPPVVSETFLNNMNKPDGSLTKDDRLFFQYMWLVENPRSPESRVDDFSAFVLHILNYDNKDHIIC